MRGRPLLVVRTALALLFLALLLYAYFVAGWIPRDLAQVGDRIAALGPRAYAPTILLQALATAALVPGFLLVIATAFFFGLDAIWMSLLGQTLGAVLAYLVARHVGHEPLHALLGQRLVALELRLKGRGFGFLLTVRLLNVVPSALVVYAPGLVRIPLRDVAGAAVLGLIPFVVVLSVLGDSLAQVGEPLDLLRPAIVLPFVLLAALVMVPVLVVAVVKTARRRTG